MEPYYGLRLARALFLSGAVVISIFAVGGIGGLAVPTFVNGEPYNAVQALYILIIGGLIALFFYTIAQLADVLLRNYQTSYDVLQETKRSNELNTQILTALKGQIRIMRAQYGIDEKADIDAVITQIEARRKRLRDKSS
ncbi:MAG: hypothetical protein ACFE0Q_08810 [Anaerolineae bacterium]